MISTPFSVTAGTSQDKPGHDGAGGRRNPFHPSGSAEGPCEARNDDVIDTFSVDPRYHSDGVDSGADDHGKSGDAE